MIYQIMLSQLLQYLVLNEMKKNETNITDSNSEADNTELPGHPENDSEVDIANLQI